MPLSSNDPKSVLQHYKNDDHLRIRQETHDIYTLPKTNHINWVLNTIQWSGDEWVLDLGCGSGRYFPKIQQSFPRAIYFGMDISTGMLQSHPSDEGNLLSADAQTIPFPDDTFDVILANHMLYHVPNIDSAIQEIQRVLKPHGILLASTNSIHNMPELQVLLQRAVGTLLSDRSRPIYAPAHTSELFALENGTLILSEYFEGVVRYDLPGMLVFEEVVPALTYLESARDFRETDLPENIHWDDIMKVMEQQIKQIIKHLGELVINKLTGVLVATNGGGFLQEYQEIQQRNATIDTE